MPVLAPQLSRAPRNLLNSTENQDTIIELKLCQQIIGLIGFIRRNLAEIYNNNQKYIRFYVYQQHPYHLKRSCRNIQQ